MALHKDYGLNGLSTDIELGKQGPHLKSNGDGTLSVTDQTGVSLTPLSGANASTTSQFITKGQFDVMDGLSGYSLSVGDVAADGDGSWTDGAVQTITNSTSVSESIDKLNEAMENVRNDTFVKSVDFTTNNSSGGNPLSVTLTTTVVGSANRYTVVWGDGDTTTATSDSTPSHTYTDNTDSPYTVSVTAYNSAGAGEGSTATESKDNFITLYTATPVAALELYTASSGGSALTGNNREIDAGETIYLENTTTNSGSATCTYEISWGDGGANTSVTSGGAGDVGQARVSHTYAADTGTSTNTITIQQTAHNTADPAEVGSTTTEILKVYDASIGVPNGLSTKTISFAESSTGSSPYLASSFTDNSPEDSFSAGSSVTRITDSSAGANTETIVMSSFAYNGSSGTISASINGTNGGSILLDSTDNSGTYGALVVTEESDYQLLDNAGSSESFASTIYSPGLYKGVKAKISKTTTDLSKGTNSFKLTHDITGNTNIIAFVKDNLTSTATVGFANATLTQASAGTLAYESGIPYYTNDATLSLSGTEVHDWIGQTYKNDSTPFDIRNGTNFESTSGSTVGSQGKSYSDIDGASSYLSSGIPIADTGKDVATKYTLGTITVNVNGGGSGVEQFKAKLDNVNGTGSYTEFTDVKIQALNSSSGVNEPIAVADALGATYDDDGKRITGFPSSDNPSFSDATNYYTDNVWSGNQTIAGTTEAVTRWGTLSHNTADLSSGYLPAGPDLNTGRSGAQYFTFAFRRTTMSNFSVTLSGKVSGIYIAAPATDIDSASTLNGWLDAGLTYGGAGTPGGNTGTGGNGSNGCAFTSGDRVIDGTTYSNDSFTFTLGDQNATNSYGNNILVRIKLEDGDSLTALSIA